MNKYKPLICFYLLLVGCLPNTKLSNEDIAKIEFYKFILLYDCNPKGYAEVGAGIILPSSQRSFEMLLLDVKIDTIIYDAEETQYFMHFCHPIDVNISIVPFDTDNFSHMCYAIVFKNNTNIPYYYKTGESGKLYISNIMQKKIDSLFNICIKNRCNSVNSWLKEKVHILEEERLNDKVSN